MAFIEEITEGLSKITDAEVNNMNWRDQFKNVKAPLSDETFLAKASISHLKFMVLSQRYRREGREVKSTRLRVEAQILNEEKDAKKCEERIVRETASLEMRMRVLKNKDKILSDLFWLAIHEDMDHLRPHTSRGIGLRDDKGVYSYDKINDSSMQIPPDIQKLIGGFFMGPIPEEEE